MKRDASVLIVDDEKDISFSLKLLLSQHYTRVTTESNPFQIPRLIRQKRPNVVLLDMNFSKGKNRWWRRIILVEKNKGNRSDDPSTNYNCL